MTDKAIIITSGGLDSTVLCHLYAEDYHGLDFLSFNYGQRHLKELDFAYETAERLDANWEIVDLSGIRKLLTDNVLTGTGSVPEGHYSEDSMKQTVVPNRNMIMFSIAIAAAVSREADIVAAGMHSGDHFVYPDCRPKFLQQLNNAAVTGTKGFHVDGFHIETPFMHMEKSEIVKIGAALNVPFERTWSCYKGGVNHCGRCGTCVERAEAFYLAEVHDPTKYTDPDFWMSCVRPPTVKREVKRRDHLSN